MQYQDTSLPFAGEPNAGPKSYVTIWLQENFEQYESASLPRGTVYETYKANCTQPLGECLNAASFGKLIRTVFPSLRTRRLGTRGMSKYHYYGIRLKPTSRLKLVHDTSEYTHKEVGKKRKLESGHQYEIKLDLFSLDGRVPSHVNVEICSHFLQLTQVHYQEILSLIYNKKESMIEREVLQYYTNGISNYRAVLNCEEFINLLIEKDQLLYTSILHMILPKILYESDRGIPFHYVQFVKQYKEWVTKGLSGYPNIFTSRKIECVSQFLHTIQMQTSLNSFSVTFRKILENQKMVKLMIRDFEQTDWNSIFSNINHIENLQFYSYYLGSLGDKLSKRPTIEQWLDSLIELASGLIISSKNVSDVVFNMSSVLSLFINDLTVRSAESFGPFHIMRGLFEEFLIYYTTRDAKTFTYENPLPRGAIPYTLPASQVLPTAYSPWAESYGLESSGYHLGPLPGTPAFAERRAGFTSSMDNLIREHQATKANFYSYENAYFSDTRASTSFLDTSSSLNK